MNFLALLLGGWGWLKNAALIAFRWALSHPWQAWLLVATLALLWQHGEINRLRGERDAAKAQYAACLKASSDAKAAAEAQRKAVEAQYAQKAKDADHAHEIQLDAARAATASYIASHRLRGVQADLGAATPAAQGKGAGVPAITTADPVVVGVSSGDVTTCAADYAYAKAAFDWANSLDLSPAIP